MKSAQQLNNWWGDTEQKYNKSLLAINKKRDRRSFVFCNESTIEQPARLYGLAKLIKDETPLWLVLSFAGS